VFGLGLWEVGVVVLLAVMLFPPKELPKLARSIARTYGSIRRTAEDFRSQIMEDEDLRAPIDEVRSAYNDARWQLKKAEAAARRELQKAEMEARRAAAMAKGEQLAQGGDETGSAKLDESNSPNSPNAAIAAADEDEDADQVAEDYDPTDEQGYQDDHLDPGSDADRVPAAAPRSFVPPPPVVAPAESSGALADRSEEPSPAEAPSAETSVA
jgi:Sec-independent protein translocase protein TatA